MLEKKYFLGEEVGAYGLKHGYVDYRTLAKTFDSVLCNCIPLLFFNTINGEVAEPEVINGSDTPYYEHIETGECIPESEYDELEEDQEKYEYHDAPEIFQYYIISSNGADILQEYTNELVYYIEPLDLYVWCITHYGTSWDYVLTDIKL